jgi:hypothetical protein
VIALEVCLSYQLVQEAMGDKLTANGSVDFDLARDSFELPRILATIRANATVYSKGRQYLLGAKSSEQHHIPSVSWHVPYTFDQKHCEGSRSPLHAQSARRGHSG